MDISFFIPIGISLIALYFSYKRYRNATVKKVFAYTTLIIEDNKHLISVVVRNVGGVQFSVNHVRIDLPIWTRRPIYKKSSSIGRALSTCKYFLNPQLISDYPSDDAIVDQKITFPRTLGIDELLSFEIDPEIMFRTMHESWEGFNNKIEFWLFCKTVKLEVVLYEKIIRFNLDSYSKDFLWNNYKNDGRLYGKILPKSLN